MLPLLAEVDALHWYLQWMFGILLFFTSLFLVLLVLVQRGRGGGLSGAFGGMGGQSAFGTKAGDVFTKITVGAAIAWIVLGLAAVKFMPMPKVLGSSGSVGIEETPGGATTTDKKSGAGAGAKSSDAEKKPPVDITLPADDE